MGVRDSIRAYNGVISWINKNNIELGTPKKKSYRALDEHLNGIWIKFGKDHDIKMTRNNSKGYKGSFSPQMANCCRIQENWNAFTKWIKENYG
tara:strand:+ start:30227 stop:30505 length:279 start_codon:yes stop_codon:yes gene_type:complete